MNLGKIWEKISLKRAFLQGFVGGIGWGLGASIGLVIIFWILGWVFSLLGGLPLIGNFIADIVSATQEALKLRQSR